MTPQTFVAAGLLAFFAAPSLFAQSLNTEPLNDQALGAYDHLPEALIEQDAFEQAMISEVHVASTANLDNHSELADSRLADLNRPVTEIRIKRLPHGDDAPKNQAAELLGDQASRDVTATAAPMIQTNRYSTCITYESLYLEQPNLERCGRHLGVLQNAVSLAQFSTRTLVLPYLVARQPPSKKVYAPGECRTGQSLPNWFRKRGTSDALIDKGQFHGAIAQAGALAGFTFLLL